MQHGGFACAKSREWIATDSRRRRPRFAHCASETQRMPPLRRTDSRVASRAAGRRVWVSVEVGSIPRAAPSASSGILRRMSISQRIRGDLMAGKVVRGEFAPAGSDLATPGTLTWSAEDGADLVLIGDTARWPGDLGEYRHTIHGVIDGRDHVTVRRAGVRRISAFGQTDALRATTLVLGEHVHEATRWSRAIYETTNLSEWIGTSGLRHIRPEKPGERAYGILWEPPPRHEFQCHVRTRRWPDTPRWTRWGRSRLGRSLPASGWWSTFGGARPWTNSMTVTPFRSCQLTRRADDRDCLIRAAVSGDVDIRVAEQQSEVLLPKPDTAVCLHGGVQR
jgi:hypothetical protein